MRKRSHLKINLNNFAHNIAETKEMAHGCELIHMVKANAYGHGLVAMVKYAVEETGASQFGCASLGEALHLRENLPKHKFDIIVFSDFDLANDVNHFLNNRIIPVISNMDDLDTFLSINEFKFLPLYLKFNTGMNRLGIKAADVDVVIKKLRVKGRQAIDHLMAHFACASLSMKKNSHNLRQINNFKILKSELSGANIKIHASSTSNSGAIIQGVGVDESHVRPGLMLYGPSGLADPIAKSNPWNGKIVSRIETYVLDEFMATKGTPVGYGSNPCPFEGQIAILGLGYGDGVGTCYSGLDISLNGVDCKLIGRVNMDMLAIQVRSSTDRVFKKGDKLSLWDDAPESISRICRHAKMIPYEIFCNISTRVPRIYEN